MEINEAFSAEQPVEFLSPCRVPTHEALQCRRLVRAEVIDREIRLLAPAPDERIDELLEGGLLGRRVERPARRVHGLTTLSDRHPAEQILEPAVLDERVALEIEEDVPGRGIRKARQAEVARLLIGSYGLEQELDDGRLSDRIPLDSRLVMHALVALGGTPPRRGIERQRGICEFGQGVYSQMFELATLQPTDPRHER